MAKPRLTENQAAMLARIAGKTKPGRGGARYEELDLRACRYRRFRTLRSLFDRGLAQAKTYGRSGRAFVRATRAGRAALAALILSACVSVTSEPVPGAAADCTTCVKRTVRTFGAATVSMESGGAILTESQGVSDGLVGMVGGTVTAAKEAFLSFFGRGSAQAPTIVVNTPAAAPAE